MIKIVLIILIILIIIYYIKYKNYNYIEKFKKIYYSNKLIDNIKKPYIVNNFLNDFSNWDFDFFKKNYGNTNIFIVKSNNKKCIMIDYEIIKTTLNEYIENYIYKKTSNNYYFRSDDAYQFLSDIGLDKIILNSFNKHLPFYLFTQISFWMGPINSYTTFHYDTDHSNLLCLLEGSKLIYIVNPEYHIENCKTIEMNYYSTFDMFDREKINSLIKEKKILKIILKKGQILNIPRYIWHAVINLENSIAFTLHYYNHESFLFNNVLRL